MSKLIIKEDTTVVRTYFIAGEECNELFVYPKLVFFLFIPSPDSLGFVVLL